MKSSEGTVNNKILYAKAVFGNEEKQAVLNSLENGWLASGPLVKEFEAKIAALFNKKYALAVNSGSSANLLALASLKLPQGSEVITPATTFATTVAPIIQNQLKPVFVDSVIGRYTINEDLIEQAITPNTKALMIPNLVGGVADMKRLREIANKYNLYLIEDSCDTLAPTLDGVPTATYSDIATTSFYGSHIITAMGMGGMLVTDNEELYQNAKIMRDWGRAGDDKEDFETRFNFNIDGIPYDSKFIYVALGYNLKMNEGAAAFGLEQLKKLPEFLSLRKRNHALLKEYFLNYEKYFYLPELIRGADTNWLAFALTIKENAPFNRYDFLKHLEAKGIQTRVLFSGNITRHPIYRDLTDNFPQADLIMKSGLLIGSHQGLTEDDILYIADACEEFLK